MEKQRTFTRYSLLLIPAGILINYLGVRLALLLELPLFLDSIGTILAAALGGYLPGIVVGFFSNVINGISDPITLYYGIVSILIAAFSAFAANRGWFARFWRSLLAVPILALIGGGVGSLLTWMLYGFSFGSGISAPFAYLLHGAFPLSEFAAQFTADMLIDLLDKLITVLAVFAVLKLLPEKFCARFPQGMHCKHAEAYTEGKATRSYRLHSLRSEVVALIVCTAVVLGALASTISYVVYKDTMTNRFVKTATGVTALMEHTIDADSIDGYLETGVEDAGYKTVEEHLYAIKDSMTDIEYMYVYQIREDGCHVVFDLDTEELEGEPLCSVVAHDDAFAPYRDALLAGKEIEPVISNETYGWLLTVYRPLYDSNGKCVAYAAADVAMTDVIADRYVFIIRITSLLFGAAIIIMMGAVWFAERRLVEPVNAMAEAAGRFAYQSAEERLKSTAIMKNLDISTGDEIENLYHAMEKTVTDVAEYITDINDKAALITRMQDNIILSFADMVESRDKCTGRHIHHTSAYVRMIAEALRARGLYTDVLTDEYIDNLERSAPLHDIGKINISDTLLNKPGKLTPEEFETMKTHTVTGRDILRRTAMSIEQTGYLNTAMDMAAHHHERWDGTGYPDSLSGTNIPLSARIMAVADVFDALISRRSYKQPLPIERAIGIIQEESGTHFDPEIVAAFLSIRADVEKHSAD